MSQVIWVVTVLLAVGTLAFADTYQDLYADAGWNDLTGVSSYVNARAGIRADQHDYFVYLRSEAYDTTGTDLPFQENSEGTSVGVGYRYWFPGNHYFATATAGLGINGAHDGDSDLRAGLAGYQAWEDGRRYTDFYGELFWVDRADDALLSLRARPGYTLNQTDNGRLWAYGVGQAWASGNGNAGTENRLEAGVGLGYISNDGWSANAELRAGYSYRGDIDDKSYFNPTAVVAGYWMW